MPISIQTEILFIQQRILTKTLHGKQQQHPEKRNVFKVKEKHQQCSTSWLGEMPIKVAEATAGMPGK